jgi:NAD(P)H-dependent flavin oxidoreductase YrpB (nitropropane dioxygenase family)
MNVAAGPKLAAAVTNAGGLGVIGGVGYTPDMLREQIAELKGFLNDKKAPFGVDLLLPQVGGNARKTKYVSDLYTLEAGELRMLTSISIATITPRESSTSSLTLSLSLAPGYSSLLSVSHQSTLSRDSTRPVSYT